VIPTGISTVALPDPPACLRAIIGCFVQPGRDPYTTRVVYLVQGTDKVVGTAHSAISAHHTVTWDKTLKELVVTLPYRYIADESVARKLARQLLFRVAVPA